MNMNIFKCIYIYMYLEISYIYEIVYKPILSYPNLYNILIKTIIIQYKYNNT